jgi:hypothetical protein
MRLLTVIIVGLLVGCTSLTKEGERVRVITANQKEGCEYLKLITERAGLGPDKLGSALKKALNETADAGGDSFYLIYTEGNIFDGASVSGEALKCKR